MNPGLKPLRSTSIIALLVGLAVVLAPARSSAQDIIYEQDFESGSGGWGADNGLWQVGEATEGPVGSGNVAGTVLDGNYAYLVGSRFMSPWIDLEGDPEVEDRFWLRFRIWFHLNAEDGVDYGRVQIRRRGRQPMDQHLGPVHGLFPLLDRRHVGSHGACQPADQDRLPDSGC